MKIIKKANGNRSIKMDRAEWAKIGKLAGWNDDGEWDIEGDDGFEPEIPEDALGLGGDEDDDLAGLPTSVKKMIEELKVDAPEDEKARPTELKKPTYVKKTLEEKQEAKAEREEIERRKRDIAKQNREIDGYQKSVYDQDPILED